MASYNSSGGDAMRQPDRTMPVTPADLRPPADGFAHPTMQNAHAGSGGCHR